MAVICELCGEVKGVFHSRKCPMQKEYNEYVKNAKKSGATPMQINAWLAKRNAEKEEPKAPYLESPNVPTPIGAPDEATKQKTRVANKEEMTRMNELAASKQGVTGKAEQKMYSAIRPMSRELTTEEKYIKMFNDMHEVLESFAKKIEEGNGEIEEIEGVVHLHDATIQTLAEGYDELLRRIEALENFASQIRFERGVGVSKE